MLAEHLKDNVLCANPLWKLSRELNTPDFGHLKVKLVARHRHGYLESTRPNCKHSQRTGGARMAVGTEKCFPRYPESLHMHRMANAVARSAVPQTEFFACTVQE